MKRPARLLVLLLPLVAACPEAEPPVHVAREAKRVAVAGVVTSPGGRLGGIPVGLYFSDARDLRFNKATSEAGTGLFVVASDEVPPDTEWLVLAPTRLEDSARPVRVEVAEMAGVFVGAARDLMLFDVPGEAEGPIDADEAARRLAALREHAELLVPRLETERVEFERALEQETADVFLRLRTTEDALPIEAVLDRANQLYRPLPGRAPVTNLPSKEKIQARPEIRAYVLNPDVRWKAELADASTSTTTVRPWMIELSGTLGMNDLQAEFVRRALPPELLSVPTDTPAVEGALEDPEVLRRMLRANPRLFELRPGGGD